MSRGIKTGGIDGNPGFIEGYRDISGDGGSAGINPGGGGGSVGIEGYRDIAREGWGGLTRDYAI